jgi:photosystem II stability/assembly factor-like uncharacterized protein
MAHKLYRTFIILGLVIFLLAACNLTPTPNRTIPSTPTALIVPTATTQKPTAIPTLAGSSPTREFGATAYQILLTTNNGVTWETLYSDLFRGISGISCPDVNTCVAVGSPNSTLQTKDRGQTWQQIEIKTTHVRSLGEIRCTNVDHCIIHPGGYFPSEWIITTQNGGNNWSERLVPIKLLDTTCPTDKICYAVGRDGNVAKSSDGGHTWTRLLSPTTDDLTGISCPDINVCYATVYEHVYPFEKSAIIATTDGGEHWSLWAFDHFGLLIAISCPTRQSCFAVGSGILMTHDSGATWNQVSDTRLPRFSATHVGCSTETACLVLGFNGMVITTQDAGSTWEDHTLANVESGWTGLSCPAQNVCYAVAQIRLK